MTEGFAAAFEAASERQKLRLLAHVAYDLTMHGRTAYQPGANGFTEPARMRSANEANHRIQSYLRAYLTDQPGRISDRAFADVLIEHMARLGIKESQLLDLLVAQPEG